MTDEKPRKVASNEEEWTRNILIEVKPTDLHILCNAGEFIQNKLSFVDNEEARGTTHKKNLTNPHNRIPDAFNQFLSLTINDIS